MTGMQGIIDGLTGLQRQYAPAIMWLLADDQNGGGRSHLLAVLYLVKAESNPNRRIQVRDHYTNHRADSMLFEYMEYLVARHHIHGFVFCHSGNTIMYDPELAEKQSAERRVSQQEGGEQ